jgi:hypothetical protein
MSLSRIFSRILDYAGHLGPSDWFWIMVAMLVAGAFLLRGFGSRKNF